MKQRSIAWSLLFAILLTAISAVFSVTAETEDMLTNEGTVTAEYCLPVDGEIIKPHDLEHFVYSPTMQDYRTHCGVDIAVPLGTEVLCYTDGTVTDIDEDALMGMTVKVTHPDGFVSLYKNLKNTLADGITVGSELVAGQALGFVGNTAYVESAEQPHLHFELYQNDTPVDPRPYLLAIKNGEPVGHIHGQTKLISVASTCLEHGYFSTVCVECGEEIARQELPLLPHPYLENGVCNVCGYTSEYRIPLDGEIIREYYTDELKYEPSTQDYRTHAGVDIAAPIGTEVHSYSAGTVTNIFEDALLGMTVELTHPDGLISGYCGLQNTLADGIAVGSEVLAGQTIGYVGDTAMIENAMEPHLHFEIWQGSEPIDPQPYLLAIQNSGSVGHIHGQTQLISVESTCLEQGYFATVCTECGEEIERQELPLASHQYRETGVCKVCGDTVDVLLSFDNASVKVGETFTVDLRVITNAGFAYLCVELLYDKNVVELVDVQNGTLFDNLTQGKYLVWASATNNYEQGTLATLTFKVKDGAIAGAYPWNLYSVECYSEEEQTVTVGDNEKTLWIEEILYGDVNDDGVVNGNDVTRLLRHLARYDSEVGAPTVEVFAGADCNGDGMIDGRDAVRLIRYLAYLDPVTGESSVALGPVTVKPEVPDIETSLSGVGSGTAEDPYLLIPDVQKLSATTREIGAGQSLMYGIQRIGGKNVTIYNANAYIIYEGTRYEAIDGVLSVRVNPAPASEYIVFEIGNNGASEQAFLLQFSDPIGSYENSESVDLSQETYGVSLAAGDSDGFCYRYTATNSGTIRFLMTASVSSVLIVTNNRNSVQRTSDFDGQTDENGWTYVEIDVHIGDELLIVVGALPNRRGKYPATNITWATQYIS